MLKIINHNLKIKNRKKGFSIGEVVLSAFIVSVVLVTVVNLIASSLKNSMNSRDHIIASQLAQEGVELIRNVRDNNWAHSADSFKYFPNNTSDDCRIDKDYNYIDIAGDDIECGSESKHLYYDGNFYVCDGAGSETKFQRKIELDYDTGNVGTAEKLTVASIVIWGGSFPATLDGCTFANKCVYAESVLTRWGE